MVLRSTYALPVPETIIPPPNGAAFLLTNELFRKRVPEIAIAPPPAEEREFETTELLILMVVPEFIKIAPPPIGQLPATSPPFIFRLLIVTFAELDKTKSLKVEGLALNLPISSRPGVGTESSYPLPLMVMVLPDIVFTDVITISSKKLMISPFTEVVNALFN
jgi:hypothetical protein